MNIKHLPFVLLTASLITLPACEKKTPVERAGEKIEDATDEVGGAVEKMGDKVEDKTDQ